MRYEHNLSHYYIYVETLNDAQISCAYQYLPSISLCFKALAILHNFRKFMGYGASKFNFLKMKAKATC